MGQNEPKITQGLSNAWNGTNALLLRDAGVSQEEVEDPVGCDPEGQ